MWNYEKRLQYPVKITQTNPKIAQIILTQFGGPDGELGAAMRYLAQRYTMPYKEVTGILTDIGTEESVQKWYQFVSYYIGRYSFLYQSICSRIQHCCQPHQHLCIQNSIFFSYPTYALPPYRAAIHPDGICIQMSLPIVLDALLRFFIFSSDHPLQNNILFRRSFSFL